MSFGVTSKYIVVMLLTIHDGDSGVFVLFVMSEELRSPRWDKRSGPFAFLYQVLYTSQFVLSSCVLHRLHYIFK